jgi:hypothetical protein
VGMGNALPYLIAALILLPRATLLLGYSMGRKVTFPPAPKCHQWGKWTDCLVVRKWFGKTGSEEDGQERVCSLCAKRELRSLGDR